MFFIFKFVLFMQQITTVTFFRLDSFTQRFWAFKQMGIGGKSLANIKGIEFVKLMGTGAGEGFSWRPDFSVYCLLSVWKSIDEAQDFLNEQDYFQQWKGRTKEQFTLFLQSRQVKGKWGGNQPFDTQSNADEEEKLVVLTRATIHNNRLLEFWRHVPQTSRAIAQAKGVLFLKGVGELPWVQQATISIWENRAAMRAYAYESKAHRDVIQKTYRRNWYSEEMFAEFSLLKTVGTWKGKSFL